MSEVRIRETSASVAQSTVGAGEGVRKLVRSVVNEQENGTNVPARAAAVVLSQISSSSHRCHRLRSGGVAGSQTSQAAAGAGRTWKAADPAAADAAAACHAAAGAVAAGAAGGPNSPVAVTVATVASGDIEVRIPALGTITPLATVTVRPQVSGILTKINFQEGQMVKAGSRSPRSTRAPIRPPWIRRTATCARDQALLADAKTRSEALRRAHQGRLGGAAAARYPTRARRPDTAARSSPTRLRSRPRRSISSTRTSSRPVTGRVGLRQVDQGNYVTPGDTNGIVVVTELQPISAIFAVPEDNVTTLMQRIAAGDRPDRGSLRSGQQRQACARARSKTVDNQIDTTTGTIKLRAHLRQQGRPAVRQPVREHPTRRQCVARSDRHAGSRGASRGSPNGVVSTFVYLVNTADNTVSVRPVTLGIVDGERVAVTKGLQAGRYRGHRGRRPAAGRRIRLLPANTPQHPTTAAPGQRAQARAPAKAERPASRHRATATTESVAPQPQ